MRKRLILALLILLHWQIEPAYAAEESQKNKEDTYRLLDLFGEIFEQVRANYVEKTTDRQLIENAINGMLTALDPHSGYMDEKTFKNLQIDTQGEFGGLGIEVTMENGLVKVVSPIDDTPAYRAGVKAGDLITHLDDKPVLGLTLSEALEIMRGRVNTDIRITIQRADLDPFDVTITRDLIRIRPIRKRVFGQAGYLRVTSFNSQVGDSVHESINDLKEQLEDKMIGIVLDLRNNPGGVLDQAVRVADIFLKQGEIVSTRARDPSQAQRFIAESFNPEDRGDILDGLPIVVLINNGSASAAEIVAGALKDHRRALVVGETSFGKGSVQTIRPLDGNGAIRLTTARYYTPSGRSIQSLGVDPDVIIEQGKLEVPEKSRYSREADLPHALRNKQIRERESDQSSQDSDDKEDENARILAEDYQLARALDFLQSLHLFQADDENG